MERTDPKHAESNFALSLIHKTSARGFQIQTAIMDKGYDGDPIHQWCME